jgi:hypothetical protein
MKSIEKTIPIEKYTEDGVIYVTFLPHDEVRVYVFRGDADGPEFPLGDPHDPDENSRTKAAEQNNKTDDSTPYRRER